MPDSQQYQTQGAHEADAALPTTETEQASAAWRTPPVAPAARPSSTTRLGAGPALGVAGVLVAASALGLLWRLPARENVPAQKHTDNAPFDLNVLLSGNHTAQPRPGINVPALRRPISPTAPSMAQLAPNDPAAPLLAKAQAAQAADKLSEAITDYQQVIALKPTLAAARLSLASLYIVSHQPARAVATLKAAHLQDAKNPLVSAALAQVYLQLQRPTDALDVVTAAVHDSPQDPQMWQMLGELRLATQKPQEALQAFVKASDLAPKDARAAFLCGAIAFDQLHQPAVAEKYMRRAVALQPNDPRGPLYLGRALATQHKLPAAEAVLAGGAHRFPTVPDLATTLAQVRTERGDKNGAIAAMRLAIAATPEGFANGLPAAQLNGQLAQQLMAAGRWAEAVAPLQHAVKLAPRAEEPSALLVMAAMHAGRKQVAIGELTRTLQIDPNRTAARHSLALMLAGEGKLDAARKLYDAYLSGHPRDVVSLADAADLDAMRKQYQQALGEWQQVISVWPENPQGHLKAAQLLHTLGRNDEAIEQYRNVLQADADNYDALWGAARLEDGLGQPERALLHLRALVGHYLDFAPAYEPLMRLSAQTHQLPSTLNFLRQKLAANAEHPVPYQAVLAYYAPTDPESGRAWVNTLITAHPDAIAPRRALTEFDLAAAKHKLQLLQHATPAPTPSGPQPTQAPAPSLAPTAKPTATAKPVARPATTVKPSVAPKPPDTAPAPVQPVAP